MLTRKTTILLPKKLHDRLRKVAKQRGKSVGALIRDACEVQYAAFDGPTLEEKLEMLRKAAALNLPVGTPAEMKRESMAPYKDLDA